MGADLIVTGMLLPINGGGDLPTREEIHRLFSAALAERDEESLAEIGDYLGLDDVEIEESSLKERVQHAIDELFGGEYDWWPRDVTVLWVKGMPLLVSGGMSWGDEPTESLGHITVLNIACLIPELDRGSPSPDYVTLVLDIPEAS